MALSISSIDSRDSILEWLKLKDNNSAIQSVVAKISSKLDSNVTEKKANNSALLTDDKTSEFKNPRLELSVDYSKSMDYNEDGEVTLDEKFKYYSIQVAERLEKLRVDGKLTEEAEKEIKVGESEDVEDEDSLINKTKQENDTENAKTIISPEKAGNDYTSEVKETTESAEITSTKQAAAENAPEPSKSPNFTQLHKVKSAYFNNSLANNSILTLSA